MSCGRGVKFFTCTQCNKPKRRSWAGKHKHICATCIRRIRTSTIVQGGA